MCWIHRNIEADQYRPVQRLGTRTIMCRQKPCSASNQHVSTEPGCSFLITSGAMAGPLRTGEVPNEDGAQGAGRGERHIGKAAEDAGRGAGGDTQEPAPVASASPVQVSHELLASQIDLCRLRSHI